MDSQKKEGCNLFYFPIGSDEVLLKIVFEYLIHINALNMMEINLLSKYCFFREMIYIHTYI